MRRIVFCVDGEPVAAARARIPKHGAPYKVPKTAEYMQRVSLSAHKAMTAVKWGDHCPEHELYAVFVTIYRSKGRGDVDNYAKGILDGITQSGLWADDRDIRRLSVKIVDEQAVPKVIVEVTGYQKGEAI